MRNTSRVAWPLVTGLVVIAVMSCGQRRAFAKAESAYNSGRYQEAVEAFTAIASGQGESSEKAQLYLGFCHFKTGRHAEAVRAFEVLPQRFPQSEWADDAVYWVGRCYEDWGRPAQALIAYRRAVDMVPPSGKANMALRAREAIDMLEATPSVAPADTGGAQHASDSE